MTEHESGEMREKEKRGNESRLKHLNGILV